MNKNITITTLNKPFVTESGFLFENPEVAYKTWGELNERRDNVVVICHALTGHSAADEWFPGLIGEGRVCDPSDHFIICINVPGSCYGSVGPKSVNPKTGRPFQGDFPDLTIRDFVRFQQAVLDQLGVEGIHFVIGASMGAMQVLEFAVMDPRVRAAIPISAGKAHSPWAIAISHAQRKAIAADPNWNNGFYDDENKPEQGLAAARMMAMVTYRSPADYTLKFGRELQPGKEIFAVESYLDYQGQKLAGRFDANTYMILTRAMDSHDLSRGRASFDEILDRVEIPVLVIGIDSDLLYPIGEQLELARLLPNARYGEITSKTGHDAFLIEFDQLQTIIQNFLQHRQPLALA